MERKINYPGSETTRKIVALRSVGKEARFITIIEPFEDKRMVKSAVATDASPLRVELNDGRVQEIQILNLDGDGNSLTAENDMKWSAIHPEPDRYNFRPHFPTPIKKTTRSAVVLLSVLAWLPAASFALNPVIQTMYGPTP